MDARSFLLSDMNCAGKDRSPAKPGIVAAGAASRQSKSARPSRRTTHFPILRRMPGTLVPVPSLDDPRLFHFRNLKDRDLARSEGRFIAEGKYLVKRLLDSRFREQTESILLSDKMTALAEQVPDGVTCFVAPEDEMSRIVGFKFHTGAIAIAKRGPSPTVESLRPLTARNPFFAVVCPDLNNGANLGGLIRTAAGLGADAFIVGERSVDPFCRYSVRVSMGAVFHVPLIWSDDLPRDLAVLRDDHGVTLCASVVRHPDATPLRGFDTPARSALLLGGEAQGLDAATIALCQRKVTIAMAHDTDSLNVTVFGAIAMWEFLRGWK
jgi:tRNA G18 (ribose-2'-O)-methylase SpoU